MYRNIESIVFVIFIFWSFYNQPEGPFDPLKDYKRGKVFYYRSFEKKIKILH